MHSSLMKKVQRRSKGYVWKLPPSGTAVRWACCGKFLWVVGIPVPKQRDSFGTQVAQRLGKRPSFGVDEGLWDVQAAFDFHICFEIELLDPTSTCTGRSRSLGPKGSQWVFAQVCGVKVWPSKNTIRAAEPGRCSWVLGSRRRVVGHLGKNGGGKRFGTLLTWYVIWSLYWYANSSTPATWYEILSVSNSPDNLKDEKVSP